jgi:hypothetical protein
MRSWFFHPLVFYPLAILFAAAVIGVSLAPQSWPREPAASAAVLDDAGALVLQGAGFDAPAGGPGQDLTVIRDFWGRAQTLRIAQLPGQPAPGPSNQGVRLLLTAEDAALLEDRPVLVEVSYNPLPINAASGLAVSLQGASPTVWVQREAPPQPGVLRFELPPQTGINSIGLHALSEGADQAYGLEIVRVRVSPMPREPAMPPQAAPAD